MIPVAFDYAAPATLGGCIDLLASSGGRALAGGTWVLPEMGRGESAPGTVVDLRHAGLGGIELRDGELRLGAMTTYADLLADPLVAQHAPMLATMAAGVTGGAALRHQATIGGSVASARPASDVPGALVALGARVLVEGTSGARSVPVADLLLDARRTSLGPGDVVVGFGLPSAAGWGHGYVKVKRGSSSWPVATAAALVRRDADGTAVEVSLAMGGVSRTPLVLDAAGLLDAVRTSRGPGLTAALTDLVAATGFAPWEDELAPGRYRLAVAAPVAARALRRAIEALREREDDREHAS